MTRSVLSNGSAEEFLVLPSSRNASGQINLHREGGRTGGDPPAGLLVSTILGAILLCGDATAQSPAAGSPPTSSPPTSAPAAPAPATALTIQSAATVPSAVAAPPAEPAPTAPPSSVASANGVIKIRRTPDLSQRVIEEVNRRFHDQVEEVTKIHPGTRSSLPTISFTQSPDCTDLLRVKAKKVPLDVGLASLIAGVAIANEYLLQYALSAKDPALTSANIRLFQLLGNRDAFFVRGTNDTVVIQGEPKSRADLEKAHSLRQAMFGIQAAIPVSTCDSLAEESRQFVPPTHPIRNRYALIVGINVFADNRIKPLTAARADSEMFRDYLLDPQIEKFQPTNVMVLQDREATRDAILNALRRIREMATGDDLVVLYFSSHGSSPEVDGGLSIIAYDTVMDAERRFWQTSVNKADLNEFFHGLKSKRAFLVLDVCYSGDAIARSEPSAFAGKDLQVDFRQEATGYSVEELNQIGDHDRLVMTPTQGSREVTTDPDGYGIIKVSASGKNERSLEDRNLLGHGIFTYFLVEGLRKNGGNVTAAYAHSRNSVAKFVADNQAALRNALNKDGPVEQTPQIGVMPPNASLQIR